MISNTPGKCCSNCSDCNHRMRAPGRRRKCCNEGPDDPSKLENHFQPGWWVGKENCRSLHGTPGQVGFAPTACRGRRDDKGEGLAHLSSCERGIERDAALHRRAL